MLKSQEYLIKMELTFSLTFLKDHKSVYQTWIQSSKVDVCSKISSMNFSLYSFRENEKLFHLQTRHFRNKSLLLINLFFVWPHLIYTDWLWYRGGQFWTRVHCTQFLSLDHPQWLGGCECLDPPPHNTTSASRLGLMGLQ